eukprot:12802988-Ditylum_brightwellii.AAC.1
MRHCLVSMCNLRLLEDRQCVTFKKGLHNRTTWRTLRDVLALKYRSQTASELDPLLQGPAINERYG